MTKREKPSEGGTGSYMLHLGPNIEAFSSILAQGPFSREEIGQYWTDFDAGKLDPEQIMSGLIRTVAADLPEDERTPTGVWNLIVQSVRARNHPPSEQLPNP